MATKNELTWSVWWEYSSWSCVGCSVMLVTMQRVKVPDKVMTYITLFSSGCGYYPYFVNIIRILWISTFRGYYSYFVDIIRILWISWIYPHFVDNIFIGRINSYLAHNDHPIFHIYSSSVSDWFNHVNNFHQKPFIKTWQELKT